MSVDRRSQSLFVTVIKNMDNDKLSQLYAATQGGLDIILDLVPQAEVAVSNPKRKFKFRTEERTPSAMLLPPKDGDGCWRLIDYGLADAQRAFSPIDLYMRERGYGQMDFYVALQELCEQFGVADVLSKKVNKPLVETRPALENEPNGYRQLKTAQGFTADLKRTWGPRVTAETLAALGWRQVEWWSYTWQDKDGRLMTTIRHQTDTYPIFALQCEEANAELHSQVFHKIYEPCNPEKQFRFCFVGMKAKNYLYGLEALRRAWQLNNEQKLKQVVLTSGCSDAANAMSMGYQPVWLDSETVELSPPQLATLKTYANEVVNIPDIDPTGVTMGKRLALKYPEIRTAWIPRDLMRLHDNRGHCRKDLKDYLQLHPQPEMMERLVSSALAAKFWHEVRDKNGNVTDYQLSATSMSYFLALHGYFTLCNDDRKEPLYIHILDGVVTPIVAKSVRTFIANWAQKQALPQALQDRIMRSRDLPSDQRSILIERNDLDFTSATDHSQLFFFRNCLVEVTDAQIVRHEYKELTDRNVWASNIIPHEFRSMKPQFTWEVVDGHYVIKPTADAQSKLMQVIWNTSRLYWRKEMEHGEELSNEEKAEEMQNFVAKVANIGYHLWANKIESEAWTTVCMDAKRGENENECNGRSGKSFYLKAIGKMVNMFSVTVTKKSNLESQFLFDGVTEATRLVVIDECPKQLPVQYFFDRITGDFVVEKKGQSAYSIPFSRSPKLAMGTNYVILRNDPSWMGRMWMQVFSDYYHVKTDTNDYLETRQISDDFGCDLMRTGYPEQDWQQDIAFMLQCLQFYLSLPAGQRKQMPPMTQIKSRQQHAAVGNVFEEWADAYFDDDRLDKALRKVEIYSDFKRETGLDYTSNRFVRKLKQYCLLKDYVFNPATVTGLDDDGLNWKKRTGEKTEDYCFLQTSDSRNSLKKAAEEEIPF